MENEIQKQSDEIFCPECGKLIKKNAVICVNCGIQIKPLQKVDDQEQIPKVASAKTKGVAVILVVFFSIFGWLYTYKKSAIKFWVSLGITIPFLILYFTPIPYWIFISSFGYLVGFGFWIWAIIGTAIKPVSYFTEE